ncbi:3'-5' exonuclease [Vibrio natriegens]|uniref:3'-5' exonuclease n=1 Tax=Vibrio natriegens TaxID=691 RepID=UPI0021E8C14C|nr:3'-5' exonuclease [Vibrio natriegens]UYI50091.1 3'-5' exonuclease [Vibrio natriegens]
MKRLFEYLHPFEKMNRKRDRYVKKKQLPQYLENLLRSPKMRLSQLASETEFVVLDLETSGLDSEEEVILSFGWVEVKYGHVDLSTSQHIYVHSNSKIKPETAVVNHITQQMLVDGVSIHEAMRSFFKVAEGKLIVAHGCLVETNFINQYLLRVFNIDSLPLFWIDTLCIEQRLQKAINCPSESDVTLSGTRERYGLPAYNGHNALADAVATAELLLAQQARITPQAKTTIGTLYRLSL